MIGDVSVAFDFDEMAACIRIVCRSSSGKCVVCLGQILAIVPSRLQGRNTGCRYEQVSVGPSSGLVYDLSHHPRPPVFWQFTEFGFAGSVVGFGLVVEREIPFTDRSGASMRSETETGYRSSPLVPVNVSLKDFGLCAECSRVIGRACDKPSASRTVERSCLESE